MYSTTSGRAELGYPIYCPLVVLTRADGGDLTFPSSGVVGTAWDGAEKMHAAWKMAGTRQAGFIFETPSCKAKWSLVS
jgi:hypothetical protein